MRRILIYFLLIAICASCWRKPEIKIKNVDELVCAITQTELYMKKIPSLSSITDTYVTFWFSEDGHILFSGSTCNYNPNDTTRKGRLNFQYSVDTCKIYPGLTEHEFQILIRQLTILKGARIRSSRNAFYNDGVFRFFYYRYSHPDDPYCGDYYLAVLTEDIIKTEDFKSRYKVMDRKGSLYLLYSKF